MKCEICGKEIKEEDSYKGCCKECASKIFDRIETNKTKKIMLLLKLIMKMLKALIYNPCKKMTLNLLNT